MKDNETPITVEWLARGFAFSVSFAVVTTTALVLFLMWWCK